MNYRFMPLVPIPESDGSSTLVSDNRALDKESPLGRNEDAENEKGKI